MLTRVFWVPEAEPNRLALMPRPHGGEDLQYEVQGWKAEGIDTVLSLLEPREASSLELDDEEVQCREAGIEFLSFPIGDRGLPSSKAAVEVLVAGLVDRLRAGKKVTIHCRVGIGRSGLIAACTLLHLGIPASQVFAILSRVRGVDVPDTAEQAHWVQEYSRRIT